MYLRPAAAHWFETYIPRNETVYALEALAETGVVQLEQDPRLAEPLVLEPVCGLIERFQRVRDKYGKQLPAPGRLPAGQVVSPERTAREAINCLEAWRVSVDALLQRQRRLENERHNLLLVSECITAMQAESHDVEHLSQKGRFLYKGVFACPRKQQLAPEICASIDEFVPGHEHNFFIIVDERYCRDIIEKAYQSEACQSLEVPDWLASGPEAQLTQIDTRLTEIKTQGRELQRELDLKKEDPAVAAALADVDLLGWYLKHSEHVASVGKLCHVTGWTSVEDVDELQQAFQQADIHGVIRFAEPPGFSKTPVNMGQHWLARPFLFILEMMGTPDSTEVDSSKLLPVIVPLLFGYMFPDVGHGLMLVLFSTVLYRRWPEGRFLIPCGLSAMLFGVVFGEVFGLEDIIAPLWISPLDNPLEVLLAPLLFGVGLILLGLVFNGAEALWRGEGKVWFLGEAAVLVLYPAVLLSLFVHEALWVVLLAFIWFVAGQLLTATSGRLIHLARGLGLLLQSVFELAQNTLSFLRVGAFALAHAALSAAILGLTDAISNDVMHMLALVLGHIFIVSIEGLVVFVQTTRLVLLEFFIRFLRAEGRMFRPMVEPPR